MGLVPKEFIEGIQGAKLSLGGREPLLRMYDVAHKNGPPRGGDR
jgi:hypothetical protein